MHITLQIMVGLWRAVLLLPDATLPFNFELKQQGDQYSMVIMNGDERVQTNPATITGDSLFIRFPVFESEFRVRVKEKKLDGVWVNYARKGNPAIPFHGTYGNTHRFEFYKPAYFDIGGRWEATMDDNTPDSSLAIGVFEQKGDKAKGTFLASGGDARYLEGGVTENEMWLSTFDGSHCWLYKAVIDGNDMEGTYWSGNHYKSHWHAHRNEEITLPDPFSITSVTQPLNFTFPDADSNLVSLSDEQFKNKAVIIQILGSWCPNCIDETSFLSPYYANNKDRGLEIIGLAFEKTADFHRAAGNIRRLKERYQVEYPLLVAGVVGKEEVMKKLQGVEHFVSYPTTIYINRSGEVEKVYSGFSGPATGIEYVKYQKEFEETVEKILEE